jgi:alkanesulfonate monooxygenase SsuD/methylene tetrahydromethanopterin reductase-like flavin-dependent oxidoreductase (luciferase family)
MTAQAERANGRAAMYNDNTFKIGFFGANCSSGRFCTMVPERWSGDYADCLRLARHMDEGGLDFLLPIGRWKGYGGDTDYQGSTYETITWATGLLAATKRLTVFGTVHAPLFHPLIAAKQMVTADHVGQGRFGLNIVCGWNEDEFDMFGVDVKDHASRYRQGQEWLDVMRKAWTEDDFDHRGEFFHLTGVREKPKPYGGTLPLTMNAGASGEGRAFALRNCDAWFTSVRLAGSQREADLDTAIPKIQEAKAEARAHGREIDVYTVGVVVCRPTRKEAEDYDHYVTYDMADWGAIDHTLAMKGLDQLAPEEVEHHRRAYANGHGGLPLIGTPDDVANAMAKMSGAGFTGIGLSFVNYDDELPYFLSEVVGRLERLGLRGPRASR